MLLGRTISCDPCIFQMTAGRGWWTDSRSCPSVMEIQPHTFVWALWTRHDWTILISWKIPYSSVNSWVTQRRSIIWMEVGPPSIPIHPTWSPNVDWRKFVIECQERRIKLLYLVVPTLLVGLYTIYGHFERHNASPSYSSVHEWDSWYLCTYKYKCRYEM